MLTIFRDDKGSAALEAGLSLPFFFFFIFGITEAGWLYWDFNSIQYAAEEAARCRAVSSSCATSDATATFAVSKAVGVGLIVSGVTISTNTDVCGAGTGAGALVTISYSYAPLTHYLPTPTVPLSASACHPM